jgi:hypothetical protein
MTNVAGPIRRTLLVLLTVAAGVFCAACGRGEPRTDAERLARGREIIDRMSTKLADARAVSVTVREAREIVKASGQPQRLTLERKLVMRRPDRLYIETSGDQRSEIWYDGVGLTMVMHKEKVFGQARMPETLDKTLDAMHERYGVATPIGDYLYSSPSKALMSNTTTGGWVGRQSLDGQALDHLAFKDTGVNWEVWIPVSGDPLPRRATATFTTDKRLRKTDVAFSDWNLSAQATDDRFAPKVPADYEGIAILQRARVLKNVPQDTDDAVSTVGTEKK